MYCFAAASSKDFSSFLPTSDAVLLVDFAATHEGFLLSPSDPLLFRQAAYKSFILFHHFLSSHTLLELLTQKREVVASHLQALSLFRFSSSWFDRMVDTLSQSVPSISSEEFDSLLANEVALSARVTELHQETSSLLKHLESANFELAVKGAKLERIRQKKESIAKARAALEAPFMP